MADPIIDMKNNDCIIAHVEMMQGIINRLADNSAKCKEWCFTLIGVLIVFVFSNDNKVGINYQILYYIVGLFCLLDAYYLGLERNLKSHLKSFVEKLNNNNDTDIPKDIFLSYGYKNEKPCWFDKLILHFWWTICSLSSFSIIIPYGLMILVTWLFTPGETSTQNS